jgi:hypothetical protein
MGKIETAKIEKIKEIMGKKLFAPEQYQEFYKDALEIYNIPEIPYEPEELLAPCPFYKDKKISEKHSLILFVPKLNNQPLTIMELQKLYPAIKDNKLSQPTYFSDDQKAWYRNNDFATKTPPCNEPTWVLMLNGIIPNSEYKTFKAQQELLPQGYAVPSAIQENLHLLFHYLTTGEYLNPRCYARVSDVVSYGSRVLLGYFDEYGLDINDCWDEPGCNDVGLAALRDFK